MTLRDDYEAVEEDSLLEIDGPSVTETPQKTSLPHRLKVTFHTYWFLGLVAFGGPSASVAIFRDHLVPSHLPENVFVELFSLSQALPGPSATQLLMATAIVTQGPLTGIVVLILYTLPGFLILTLSGVYLHHTATPSSLNTWLQGVAPAAVALICKACHGFLSKLDGLGVALAMISCSVSILITGDSHLHPTSSQYIYPLLLIFGGLTTFLVDKMSVGTGASPNVTATANGNGFTNGSKDPTATATTPIHDTITIGIPVWVGVVCFVLWVVLFAACFFTVPTSGYLSIFAVCWKIGSILFGGGIVVVPMLQAQVVPLGWMSNSQFLTGLGLAQSLPGPVSNLVAFCGAVHEGVLGAIVAFLGLFGPGCLLRM